LIDGKIRTFIENQEFTIFSTKDLLRAKCTFDRIEDIVDTGNKLNDHIQKSDSNYKIIELKDKLYGKTKDAVPIIKLHNVIAELQLVLSLNSVSNEFNHKLYELKRA
jgi:hypothetical protein